ncbi:MAG: PepSY-associated TM helix domain-containing protein [Pseudomonadota bacterium]
MGALLGWLLYVVNFSGSVAMFVEEIKVWEDPIQRATAAQVVPLQPIIDALVREVNGPLEFIEVTRPSPGNALYQLRARYTHAEESHTLNRYYSIDTGIQEEPRAGDGVALWLKNFHRYLAIEPKSLGRALVGLTGVYMLALILTGVVVHRRILRDLLKVRWSRSLSVKWKDLHNATGLWTLPFAVVIAFSGIMVGAIVLFGGVAALSLSASNPENLEKLENLLADHRVDKSLHGPMPMVSADVAMANVAKMDGFAPLGVSIQRYGDRNAAYAVLASSRLDLAYLAPVPIDAVSGEPVVGGYTPIVEGLPDSVATRIFSAMTPLHYGLYGNTTLKLLYYFLGLAVSICVVVGMLLYFEKRLDGPTGHFSHRTYHWLAVINAGILAGLPLATVLIFYLDRLLFNVGDTRYAIVGIGFFAAWVACTVYCLWLQNARQGARHIMLLTVVLGLTLPVFDLATVGSGSANPAVMVIHGVILSSAAGLLLYLRSSPSDPKTAMVTGRPGTDTLEN